MDSFYVLHVADQDDLEDVEEGGAGGLASKMTKKVTATRGFAMDDDAGEGGLVEVDPGAGHRPKLFAVPHAGIGQHRRYKAGMGRAVGE